MVMSMKVKIIKQGGYGDRYGVFHKEGEAVEYIDHVAAKLITLGVAAAVPKVETTARAPVANAATRTGKVAPRTQTTAPKPAPKKED